jgi:hypothetical protein
MRQLSSLLSIMVHVLTAAGRACISVCSIPAHVCWRVQFQKWKLHVRACFGCASQLNPADGAFYGPKIDITVFDALRRKFQCATVQLDFQLPIRFNLQARARSSSVQLSIPSPLHAAFALRLARAIHVPMGSENAVERRSWG